MARRNQTIFALAASMLLFNVVFAQDRIEQHCNPSLKHRFELCPKGYCCVRDEFLPSYVYCRKIGRLDDNCTTKETDSECPCAEGLYCKANIVSSFMSLYGRCYNATKDATTTTTTTTAPNTSDAPMTSPDIKTTTTNPVSDSTGSQKVTGDSVKKVSATTGTYVHTTRPPFDFHLPIIG